MNSDRRNFIKKVALSAGVAISIPEIVSAAIASKPGKKISLGKGNVILFQGDSITDAGRNKDEMAANNTKALGSGYAFMAASQMLYKYPDKELSISNKGISGNKVYQLAERWDADCLELKPDVLSILIGVNDYWHMRNGNYNGTVEIYKNDYHTLLERTKNKFPGVKLIIGEPFAVTGLKAVDETWFPALTAYQEVAKEIASEFNASFIPYQKIFNEAQKKAPGIYWTFDGVHPSIAGAQLMAASWQEMVK